MKGKRFIHLAILLLIAVGFAAAGPAEAQNRRARTMDPERHLERRIQMLDRYLELTDPQEDQIRQILTENAEEVAEWRRAHPDATREQRQAFGREQSAAVQEAIKAVLTSEQLQKYEELTTQRRERQVNRPGFNVSFLGWNLNRMARYLDLTDAQRTQIQEILNQHRAEIQEWRSQNPEATREAYREFMSARREEFQADVESLLTPEQVEKLASERRGFRGRLGVRRFGWDAASLARRLDLTESQRDQIEEIWKEHREAITEWMQAHPQATREERRAFMAEQFEASISRVEGLLNPRQVRALEDLRSRWQRRVERNNNQVGGANNQTVEVSEQDFALSNHPNPFNPSTEIRFELPQAAHVSLIVYDAQGRTVQTLVNGIMEAGPQSVHFDASGLPSGTYLYRLTVGGVTRTGNMTLVK